MRKHISTIVLTLLIATVLPAPALFAQGCILGATNTVAGLGTQVTLKGCAPNKSYMLTMTPGTYSQSVVTMTRVMRQR